MLNGEAAERFETHSVASTLRLTREHLETLPNEPHLEDPLIINGTPLEWWLKQATEIIKPTKFNLDLTVSPLKDDLELYSLTLENHLGQRDLFTTVNFPDLPLSLYSVALLPEGVLLSLGPEGTVRGFASSRFADKEFSCSYDWAKEALLLRTAKDLENVAIATRPDTQATIERQGFGRLIVATTDGRFS